MKQTTIQKAIEDIVTNGVGFHNRISERKPTELDCLNFELLRMEEFGPTHPGTYDPNRDVTTLVSEYGVWEEKGDKTNADCVILGCTDVNECESNGQCAYK